MIVVDDCLATRILIYFVCLGAHVFASIRTVKMMTESQAGDTTLSFWESLLCPSIAFRCTAQHSTAQCLCGVLGSVLVGNLVVFVQCWVYLWGRQTEHAAYGHFR